MSHRATIWALAVFVLLGSCSHAPPRLVQVFSQVNRVYDPATHRWSERLAVFVQASSADGTQVFDRLHVIHDAQALYYTLPSDRWTILDRPGEFWVGSSGLAFPDGVVATGTWRAVLVTRSGTKMESSFEVPPPVPGPPSPWVHRVNVTPQKNDARTFQVFSWVEDYLVWSRGPSNQALSQQKIVGASFSVPPDTVAFTLYSYDKTRGMGLEAGPFLVQESGKPADE